MGYGSMKTAILCNLKEEYFNVSDFNYQHINPYIERKKALSQFDKFKKTLLSEGVKILEVDELKGHPNSVFVRDTAVILNDHTFIRVNMGLSARKGEEKWMAEFLKSHGFAEVGAIDSPGTLEGGDVIISSNVAFVGISGRTNESGALQIKSILNRLDYEVRISKFKGAFLHIGGGMTLIGSHTVLHCSNAFPSDFFKGFDEIIIDCNDFIGGNVVAISDKKVISLAQNIFLNELLVSKGIDVIPLNLSEFVKGNGGPSCMVLPVG